MLMLIPIAGFSQLAPDEAIKTVDSWTTPFIKIYSKGSVIKTADSCRLHTLLEKGSIGNSLSNTLNKLTGDGGGGAGGITGPTGPTGLQGVTGATGATGATTSNNWHLISTADASNSATVEFTGLDATYRIYKVIISNVVSSLSTTTALFAQQGTGGTPTYQTTNYHQTAPLWFTLTSASSAANGSTVSIGIYIDWTGGVNSTFQNTNSEVTIYNPAGTVEHHIGGLTTSHYRRSSPSGIYNNLSFFGGYHQATTPMTAIRFLFDAGNIVSGNFTLYGIANN